MWCILWKKYRQCQEPIKEKEETGTLSNKINCGGIGTLK